MTQEEAIEQMKEYDLKLDVEDAHINADYLLCEILIQLGWEKLVEEYHKLEKWYS